MTVIERRLLRLGVFVLLLRFELVKLFNEECGIFKVYILVNYLRGN